MITWPVILLATCSALVNGCQFLPAGEYLRFVRLPENLPVGGEVLQVEVHPRHGLSLQPIDKAEDATYFEIRELSSQLIMVALARSLEDLVDGDSPQNVLKFRLVCDYQDGDDTISSFLSVTVYVEDVNDHSPVFVNAPYHVTVDELTPVGATLFRDVRALDGDKPNTANSEVALSIAAGDAGGRFSLQAQAGARAALVLTRPLDYDAGDVEFDLTLLAVDHGSPPRNATTQLVVSVVDNDDLPPKFTRDVYRTQINEFYPITGARIHQEVRFSPPIQAYDQDASLNAALRYDIVSGNEQRLFAVDAQNGSLFLERELDRERVAQGGVLTLQLQASQVDRPLRVAHARVEVQLLDINDNLPEFEVDAYNISIVENLPNGFSVLQVAATDRDQGENAEFWFELEDPERAFAVESDSGWLTVRDQSRLDREARPALRMWVVAREKAPSVAAPADAASRVAVEVTLLDANDNNPVFQPDNLYSFSVRQDAAPGTVVGKVWATDVDLGRNGQVLYSVQAAGNGSNNGIAAPAFTVDAQSGEVAVAPGARLTPGRHALFVQAADQPENPSERRSSIAVVSVEVLPAGRAGAASAAGVDGGLEPDFVGAPYEFWVGSTVPVGTSVGQLRTNAAVDPGSAVFDLLHSFHQGVPFAVEERSGVISVVDDIGKYSPTLYDFEAVVAADPDIALLTNVTIHVVKLDGAHPQDIKHEVEMHVLENQPALVVGRLPPPAVEGGEVRYTLANGHEEAARSLAVGADGALLALRPLDRELRDVYHLTALAETHRGIAAVYQVTVFVDDENDNAPAFEHAMYEGWVREDALPGAEVRLQPRAVRAADADAGRHGAFSLALRGDGSSLFRLDPDTGKLYLRAPLDRERTPEYSLSVVARDTGNLTSEASLVVHVTDVNDNAPRFVQVVVLHEDPRRSEARNVSGARAVEVSVPESAPAASPLLRLLAQDRDAGDNASLAFSLASEAVAAGPRGPWAHPHHRSVAESLNHSDAFLQLGADGDPAWERTQYRTSREDSRQGWTVTRYSGDDDADVAAGADDAWLTASRRRTEWAQPPPSAPADNATGYFFAVHRTRGEIRPLRRLPAETTFILQVVATDGPGLSDTLELRIRVLDVNDHAPEFERPWYRFEVQEWNSSSAGRQQEVGRVVARDLDHGDNARLSYHLLQPEGSSEAPLPFRLGAEDGVLAAVRPLDREQTEVYAFKVRAQDQAPPPLRRSATVDVQVVVLDVNDNAPVFEGFSAIETDAGGRPLPVYRASVRESAPAGLEVARVSASDADAGRNALLLFSLADSNAAPTVSPPGPRRRPLLPPPPPPPLTVDPRSGAVSLSAGAAPLDAERTPIITARVVAADLGSPSLSATALIQVEVQPEPEGHAAAPRAEVFSPRYLEVSVEENCQTPLAVAALNVSAEYRGLPLNLSVAPSPHAAWFSVAPHNASLMLVLSPDREDTPRLHVTVRATYSRRGRQLMLYPPDLSDLGHDEARVVVVVRDVNDNSPRFVDSGRPLVAAIPTSTTYGHHILTVKAEDLDEGVNGEVRYSLLGGVGSGPQARFAVDAASGRVRALSSFRRDAGRVFGFDVKATDRRGADDGRSTIANVLVYVLEDDKQVVMVVATKPTMVEKNVENITTALYNATGLDVRVRKLEPHMARDNEIVSGTDLYLYAVDPHMNAVIDMDTLQNVLTARQADVRRRLERFRVLQVSAPSPASASRPPTPATSGQWLSSLEAVVLALGLVVFVGAFATAVCIGCARRKNRLRRQEELGKALTSPFTLSAAPSGGAYNGDTTDTYVDMHSRRSGESGGGGGLRHHGHHRHHRHHRHAPTCSRAHHGLQASLASLHSRDSGVGGSHRPQGAGGRCICGHSTSHSSDSSGGSYEDSLKGAQARRVPAASRRQRQRHSSASAASSVAAAPVGPAPPTPCLPLPPPSGRGSPCATLGRRPSQRDAGSVR